MALSFTVMEPRSPCIQPPRNMDPLAVRGHLRRARVSVERHPAKGHPAHASAVGWRRFEWPRVAHGLSLLCALACSASDEGNSGRRSQVGAPDESVGNILDGDDPPGGSGFDDFGGANGAPPGGTASGCATSISGVTRDPAGQLPLYNVVVYVPSEALAPLESGAACETCDGNFSGRPIAATVSDAAGNFRLDITNVPQRENIPLVVQAGKWRRQVTLASAADCADTPVGADLSRLPRNRAEGDLPRIAVMRAGSDALECLFTKIGVDLSEFAPGGRAGSVELYYSDLENATDDTGRMSYGGGVVDLPNVDTLFANYAAMQSYNMILMSCEGGDERYGSPDLAHRENLQRYANEGGRLFGGHFHNSIIDNRELPDDYPPFPPVVEFASGRQDIEPQLFTANVNLGFDKGQALADWLVNVGGSTTRGQIQINDSERTVVSMLSTSAVSWIDADTEDGRAALYYGFPTPVDGPACGRMVFTDVHVASGSGDSGKEVFPSCSTELSPQQKALAFLIFDLANCVRPTETEPPPPIIIY